MSLRRASRFALLALLPASAGSQVTLTGVVLCDPEKAPAAYTQLDQAQINATAARWSAATRTNTDGVFSVDLAAGRRDLFGRDIVLQFVDTNGAAGTTMALPIDASIRRVGFFDPITVKVEHRLVTCEKYWQSALRRNYPAPVVQLSLLDRFLGFFRGKGVATASAVVSLISASARTGYEAPGLFRDSVVAVGPGLSGTISATPADAFETLYLSSPDLGFHFAPTFSSSDLAVWNRSAADGLTATFAALHTAPGAASSTIVVPLPAAREMGLSANRLSLSAGYIIGYRRESHSVDGISDTANLRSVEQTRTFGVSIRPKWWLGLAAGARYTTAMTQQSSGFERDKRLRLGTGFRNDVSFAKAAKTEATKGMELSMSVRPIPSVDVGFSILNLGGNGASQVSPGREEYGLGVSYESRHLRLGTDLLGHEGSLSSAAGGGIMPTPDTYLGVAWSALHQTRQWNFRIGPLWYSEMYQRGVGRVGTFGLRLGW